MLSSRDGGQLDDPAQVHHRDPVADVADDREVVGDEQVGQAEPVLEPLEQVDDLGLDRHVEGADRLVGHDEVGLQGERPGDADPLALAAGELVRVAVGVVGVEADRRQQLADPLAALVLRAHAVDVAAARRRSPPAVIRGLRLAYGSWKIICIRRAELRAGRRRRAVADVAAPSKRIRAGRRARRAARSRGRSCSCRSPTRRPGRASRRGASVKEIAVDRADVADVALEDAGPRVIGK